MQTIRKCLLLEFGATSNNVGSFSPDKDFSAAKDFSQTEIDKLGSS